jgi:DNA polymerase III alpha subunit (gram-positive type)
MEYMTHVMVDLETTDTDPSRGGILQLAAIKFNLETGALGGTFDRCPSLLRSRRWSDSTAQFWSGHNDIYQSFQARVEPAEQVFRDFADFVSADGALIFVAKPVKFDWPFLESHFNELQMDMPFAHWAYLDMNSYILGAAGAVAMGQVSPAAFPDANNALAHNALYDCAHQIDTLMSVRRHYTACEAA